MPSYQIYILNPQVHVHNFMIRTIALSDHKKGKDL